MFYFVREFLVWISKATEISFEQVRVLFSKLLFCCRYFHLQMSCQAIYIFVTRWSALFFKILLSERTLVCLIKFSVKYQIKGQELQLPEMCVNMQEEKIHSVFVFRNSSSSQNSFFENIHLCHIPSANRCETKKNLN